MSLVVPGYSLTMAMSFLDRVLTRVLLPTLGFPTMATEMPCLRVWRVL